MKIVVLSDVHFATGEGPPDPSRQAAIADVLFQRAVDRTNETLRPDVTVLLGDLVDGEDTPSGVDCLRRIRKIADGLEMPVIAIPGNHDPAPDTFYSIFERPAPFLDVKGVRLAPFVDPEAPEYNATRPKEGLRRMAEARAGFDGPIVTLQHVPVFPPGMSDCPFNYTNAEAVIGSMREHGIGLAVSAHYHEGIDLIRAEGSVFFANPALCESPFRFSEIEVGENLQVRQHALESLNDSKDNRDGTDADKPEGP